jgi:hypothetical protein
MQPRLRPTGICKICNTVTYGESSRHFIPVGGPCNGRVLAAPAADDWRACYECQSAGAITGGVICPACNGVGWLFVRSGGLDGTTLPGLGLVGRLDFRLVP